MSTHVVSARLGCGGGAECLRVHGGGAPTDVRAGGVAKVVVCTSSFEPVTLKRMEFVYPAGGSPEEVDWLGAKRERVKWAANVANVSRCST